MYLLYVYGCHRLWLRRLVYPTIASITGIMISGRLPYLYGSFDASAPLTLRIHA